MGLAVVCAESQNRTGDTAIFSRVLYQLSYLGWRVDCTEAREESQENGIWRVRGRTLKAEPA